jgi:hypothetical protein
MPISSRLILANILSSNVSNTGQHYPLKMKSISEAVSSWLSMGGVTLSGRGVGSGGIGTATGVMNLLPDVTSMDLAFKANGLFLAEKYYLPVVLGLSALKYPVVGASPIVGVGSWSGAVDMAMVGTLYIEIDLAMLKNGVSGFYKGEISAWAMGICSLFSTGSVVGGIIVGTSSPISMDSPLTKIKVA